MKRHPWPFMVQARSWAEQAADCLPTQGEEFEHILLDYPRQGSVTILPQKHRDPKDVPDPFLMPSKE